MIDYKQYFKDKKITIMGLGLLGRGIGVTKFLADLGAEIVVTDLKDSEQLAPALEELSSYKNIKFVLGEHRLEDFADKDFIIKAANVPLDSPHIAEARKNNIPIKMDASLFLELAPPVVSIGVTGTRGKSTVTHLIENIIKEYLSTQNDDRKLYLGGNVRGMATLPLLAKVKEGDFVVFELDSWQLQGFGDSQLSPHIAVFTNLMADHLNYYQGDMKRYFEDKKNIYRFQTADDYLIAGKSISPLIRKSGKGQGKFVAPLVVPSVWSPKLIGKHNVENIALALTVASVLNIPTEVTRRVVESFTGVPGRLEFVRELGGVKYYNDTTATMPDATIAALEALSDSSDQIILIAGGNDKNLDYTRLGETLPKYVQKLVLFPGSGSDKLQSVLPKEFLENIIPVTSMDQAVREATALAQAGGIVLLSPGATSFGLFKNEFDRGDQFNDLVKKLF